MSDSNIDFRSVSLVEVVRRLSRSRRFVPIFAGLGFLLGVGLWAILPRVYVSEATLLPSGGDDLPGGSGLSSLVGSLGISLPGSMSPESQLYPSILKSERVIERVLMSPLDAQRKNPKTLFDLVADQDAKEQVRLEKAVGLIRREFLWVGMDEMTGIVRLNVRYSDPVVANQVCNRFVSELEAYMREDRNSRSRENLAFVESRREEAAAELAVAEGTLREFRETNRKINNSPDLLLLQARLVRDVRVQEEVFLELTRQFEIARIEAQKASPILEILDPPTLKRIPNSPKLPILAGTGLLIGIVLGSLVAVVAESLSASLRGFVSSIRMLLGFR